MIFAYSYTYCLHCNVIVFAYSQINKEDGMVEASRIMNLYQFIQLYRDITSQAAEVLSAEGTFEGPSAQLPSTDSCQASMWMGRSVCTGSCPLKRDNKHTVYISSVFHIKVCLHICCHT